MTKKTIIILSVIGTLVIGGLLYMATYIDYYNRNVELQSQYKAQYGNIEANYDKMWKVLKDQAGVTTQYATNFKDIYTEIIGGRYSKGDGTLMKWITESNPNFDSSLYGELMETIEALRSEFENEQKRMLDIIREHDNLRNMFWSNIFLGDIKTMQYKIISMQQSKITMKTGVDNYQSLF